MEKNSCWRLANNGGRALGAEFEAVEEDGHLMTQVHIRKYKRTMKKYCSKSFLFAL